MARPLVATSPPWTPASISSARFASSRRRGSALRAPTPPRVSRKLSKEKCCSSEAEVHSLLRSSAQLRCVVAGSPRTPLAATEAQGDAKAYQGRVVVAISQSGRSSDVLLALDALQPRRTIALTNTADSPLGARANLTIDIGAGPELAIPATKSVSCTIAILLSAASLICA